jgi:hypothetical protein
MQGLQRLTKKKISPEVLSELLCAPVFAIPVRKLAALTQSYVQDASLVNLSLNKLIIIIDCLDKVNFEQLNDEQKSRIVKFAEEIDHLDGLVRGEVYEGLASLYKDLTNKLNNQNVHNQDFLKSLEQCLDQNIAHISQKIDANVEWTQGKKILQWEEIEGWLSRYGDVDRSKTYVFRTQEATPKEELEQYIKTIVYAESLIACKDRADEGKGMFSSSMAEKAFKACNKTPVPMPELQEESEISMDLFEQMEGIYEEISKMHEEILSYPFKESDLSSKDKKDFKKMVSKSIEYSPVIVNDDLRDV